MQSGVNYNPCDPTHLPTRWNRSWSGRRPRRRTSINRTRRAGPENEALRQIAQEVLPEEKVHSIDEMSYRLIGDECRPETARKLALEMKDRIRTKIGPYITCSIGIAPNDFLAKVATEIEKPNGLVVLEGKDLPGRLLELKLFVFVKRMKYNDKIKTK